MRISFLQRHLNTQAVALNEDKTEVLIYDLQRGALNSRSRPLNKGVSFSAVTLVSRSVGSSSEFSCYNNVISPEFSINEGGIYIKCLLYHKKGGDY